MADVGWVSRIDWCEGHWWYMVERLSDVSSKTGKKGIFCVLGCFCTYVGQPQDHIGWTTPMPLAPINPTNPWNFHKKYWALAELENELFFELAIWFFGLHLNKKKVYEISFISAIWMVSPEHAHDCSYSIMAWKYLPFATLWLISWDIKI